MVVANSKTWENAREIIRQRLNQQSYETWFLPMRFVDLSDDNMVLEVPHKFFLGWVSEKYKKAIEDALAACLEKNITVTFVLAEQGAAAPAPEARAPRPSGTPQARSNATGINKKYSFDGFVVGPSNRFAHAASVAVSETPAKAYNPLFIYGGVGLGKTHLMQAIGNKASSQNSDVRVLYISSEQFTNQLISAIQNRTTVKFRQLYRSVDILLIDDIQFISGKEATQEEFFHTFNALHDAHKQIVLSSDRSPKDIPDLEERLVSRFEWGLVTDIQPPDLETRIAILRKKAERETVSMPDDVSFFIAEKIKSNIRELEGAMVRVAAYAKLIGREVSVPLVKDVLKDMVLEDEVNVSVELIQQKTAEYFNIKLSELKGKKRNRAIVYPRQVAMYLARDLTDYSLPEIGSFFGGRDHTTVLHACDKITKSVVKDRGVKNLLNRLIVEIKA
jgi:chromosomal replication initiator protein